MALMQHCGSKESPHHAGPRWSRLYHSTAVQRACTVRDCSPAVCCPQRSVVPTCPSRRSATQLASQLPSMASLRQTSRAAGDMGAGARTDVPCCEAAWGGSSGAVLLTAVPRGHWVSRVSGTEGNWLASGKTELCAEAEEAGESSGAESGAAESVSEQDVDVRSELVGMGMCWLSR